MENRLVQAIQDLENSSYQFSVAMDEIERVGDIDDREGSSLYCAIIGNTWQKYLAAGGSPSMINDVLPRHQDFNHNHRAEPL